MGIKPTRISASRGERQLVIQWDDGKTSRYALSGLRAACPCAECRGGHEKMGQPGSPDMLELPLVGHQSDELVRIDQVGNYAIQLHWSDGHSYGIYSWEYLKELDPGVDEEEVVE